MTTTSVRTSKPTITKEELRQGLKQFLPFSVTKIGETLADLLVTLLFTGITIAILATLQNIPLTFGEMTIYIISIFVLIIVRRVVQDFDEQYTFDELADQMMTLKRIVVETHMMVKNNSTTVDEEELDQRLQSLE